jgi:hypothetical protein
VQRNTEETRKERCTKSLAVALLSVAARVLSRRNKRQRPAVETAPRPKQAADRAQEPPAKAIKPQQQQQETQAAQRFTELDNTTISSSTTFRQPLPLQLFLVRLCACLLGHPLSPTLAALSFFTPDATSVPTTASSLHAPPRPLRLPPLFSPSAPLSKRMLE